MDEDKNKIEDLKNMLEIYFSTLSPLQNIKVKADSVDKIMIEGGFLKVHDKIERGWHCYNMHEILHFHYPDKVVKSK